MSEHLEKAGEGEKVFSSQQKFIKIIAGSIDPYFNLVGPIFCVPPIL